MRIRHLVPLVVALAPLLLAFSDPGRDLTSCSGATAIDAAAPIDIVRATGVATEKGTALAFTITFAEPLPVPDADGRPLRVDVVLRDPSVPALSFAYYEDLNRIVRFDAVEDPELLVLLLPEEGRQIFPGVTAEGATLTMEIPLRLIAPAQEDSGFDIAGLRWSVITRDQATCDRLGDGVPSRKIKVRAEAPPSPAVSATPSAVAPTSGDPVFTSGLLVASLVAMVVGAGVGVAAARWRSRAG